MMPVGIRFNHLRPVALCMLLCWGCGHRQGAVPVATTPARPVTPATQPLLASVSPSTAPTASFKTYRCPTADIQFDYPGDWLQDKAKTAIFAINAPTPPANSECSLNLDVPKLPWHPPGLISVGMVASGYEDDLKKNQMHDAVKQEDCTLEVPGAKARRITSSGHCDGKTLIDIAVILIHADRVYILSADCDDKTRDNARKTLDTAVASLKWTK